ncbi:MAG: hypothetical protein GEU81_10605 [Nitriliruptorales bacterium]|nr:hypothetical protein [Nitriliruptorales bacterium]
MTVRRSAVLLVAVATLLVGVLAGPALAHGRGSDATNFSSRILSAPDLPGVSWRIYGGDEFLAVTNDSDIELVVVGYNDEPYLRIGPEGVFENRNSPATYTNSDRYGATAPPADIDPDGEPVWDQVGSGSSYAWHDHRVHWMSPLLPPTVTANEGAETVVQERWSVPVRAGGDSAEVVGELRWIPGPSPWPWLVGALVVTLPVLLGLRTEPTSEDRWPSLARPAAVLVGLLAVANLTHLVDDLLAVPLPLGTTLLAASQSALFIALAGFGALRGWQAREGAFTALGVGSAALLIGQGLLYLAVLTSSQTASLFPHEMARAIVALSIVQALPVGLVAVIGTRRLLPPEEQADLAAVDVEPAT